jgi:hypothetical protein
MRFAIAPGTAAGSNAEEAINEEIQRQRMHRSGVDEQVFRNITRRLQVRQKGLAEVSASGELHAARDTNRAAAFGVPIGAMFLPFMLVMSSVPAMMSSVLEEKGQKIAEVLIASISPFQLMLGKLLAGTLVSLTLAVLYLGAIVFGAWKNDFLGLIPAPMFFWFFLFQALALLNNPFMVRMSQAFADRIKGESSPVTKAIELIYQREPNKQELSDLETYAKTHGLANLCRLLFNTNEFLFAD